MLRYPETDVATFGDMNGPLRYWRPAGGPRPAWPGGATVLKAWLTGSARRAA